MLKGLNYNESNQIRFCEYLNWKMVIYVKSVLQLQLTFLQFEFSNIGFPYGEEEKYVVTFCKCVVFFLFINFL